MPATSHPSLVPDLLYPSDLRVVDPTINPNDPNYQWHFLAEGDSWFTIGAIPSSNLLLETRYAKWTQILSLAYPGDTLKHISALTGNADLRKYLAMRNFSYKFDALLISAGGNDLIDAAADLIKAQAAPGKDPALPDSYINGEALASLMSTIQTGHQAIAALRDSTDSKSRNAPIFTHTYDYSTPRNAPARFLGAGHLAGPWLFKAFAGTGIPPALQQLIANRLNDTLAETLLELDSANVRSGKALPAFHVIDTRNTLIQANPTEMGNSNDWLNEIHPNLGGYRKIAARLSEAVNQTLLLH